MASLQEEVMRRLMAGETMPSILEDMKRKSANGTLPNQQTKKKKYTKEQYDKGKVILDDAIDDIVSLLLVFDYKLEAVKLSALTDENKKEVLQNIDEIIVGAINTIQALQLKSK